MDEADATTAPLLRQIEELRGENKRLGSFVEADKLSDEMAALRRDNERLRAALSRLAGEATHFKNTGRGKQHLVAALVEASAALAGKGEE